MYVCICICICICVCIYIYIYIYIHPGLADPGFRHDTCFTGAPTFLYVFICCLCEGSRACQCPCALMEFFPNKTCSQFGSQEFTAQYLFQGLGVPGIFFWYLGPVGMQLLLGTWGVFPKRGFPKPWHPRAKNQEFRGASAQAAAQGLGLGSRSGLCSMSSGLGLGLGLDPATGYFWQGILPEGFKG